MSFVRVCKLNWGKVILGRRLLPECNVKTSDIVRILMSKISARAVFFLIYFFFLHFTDNHNGNKKKSTTEKNGVVQYCSLRVIL